jgi:hypothetical protein
VRTTRIPPGHPARAGPRWTGEAGDSAGARDQFAELWLADGRVCGREHPSTRVPAASWLVESGRPGRGIT